MSLDFGFASFASKRDLLDRSATSWNADKVGFWERLGVPIVIGERSGYDLTDVDGRELIDVHLNGGTYNLGHRNPELIATLEQAMGRFDIGNHHFPALARTALAEALVATCPPALKRVIYASGGGEATDIAIKTARHTRQKRKIVSIRKGYHGHTGLAVVAGDELTLSRVEGRQSLGPGWVSGISQALAARLWNDPATVSLTGRAVETYARRREALSAALRKLGFRFVGPTTMYALMQSAGMVDDHLAGCWRAA